MKKVPLRKCVATGEQLPKKELIRIVKNKEGEVSVDPTGKKNGRGAYLKRSLDAIELAKKYGEDSSSAFVNGILASIVKENR